MTDERYCHECAEWPCICGAIEALVREFEECSVVVSVVTYERSTSDGDSDAA